MNRLNSVFFMSRSPSVVRQKYMYVYDIGATMLCVGIVSMDQTLKMLGMTSVFVGGFMALILDNMIPGMTSRLTGRHLYISLTAWCLHCC